jgi:hypothetical protein
MVEDQNLTLPISAEALAYGSEDSRCPQLIPAIKVDDIVPDAAGSVVIVFLQFSENSCDSIIDCDCLDNLHPK